jgi:hypothetical protein
MTILVAVVALATTASAALGTLRTLGFDMTREKSVKRV